MERREKRRIQNPQALLPMQIGGLQKLSLIDYPQKIAAVIFTQKCNMFCPYCHNPQLVYPHLFGQSVREDEVFAFLEKRRNVLEGVVISGGEPTVQTDLGDFIAGIKKLGYAVKLDTNGSNPQVLTELIENRLIDFIAMDIKSPLYKYGLFYKGDLENVKLSIEIIKSCGLPYLFRTTYDKDILNEADLVSIKELCSDLCSGLSSPRHIVQECRK
jgi:pyruvate formate lyase activating enzyme